MVHLVNIICGKTETPVITISYMLPLAAKTHGKLSGLKVEHALGDLEKLSGSEGELAAGKYLSVLRLSKAQVETLICIFIIQNFTPLT